MITSQNFLVRCGISMLLGASMMLAAAATMLLGWIITAHASAFVPNASDRGESPILCQVSLAPAPCPADEPLFVTKPATLVAPQASWTPAMARKHLR
jgi:hypothetical protein